MRLLYSGDQATCSQPPWVLQVGATPIGRTVQPQRGVSLPADRRASGHHATVHVGPGPGKQRITDERSKNGTFVNGERISERPLQDGDLIRTGDSFFSFRLAPDTPEGFCIDGFLGNAPAIQALRHQFGLVGCTSATVLLLGESGDTPRSFDTRILAATNRDVALQAKRGSFRGDLYARLAKVILRLPPLRDRREDILLLFQAELHRLRAHEQALRQPTPHLTPALVEALLLYPWPYNVREVAHVASRLCVLGEDPDQVATALESESDEPVEDSREGPAPAPAADGRSLSWGRPARERVEALHRELQGNVSAIARALGKSRRQTRRWLMEYGLMEQS